MSEVIGTYYVAKAGLVFGAKRNIGDPIEVTTQNALTCDRLIRTGNLVKEPVKPKVIANNSVGKGLTPEQALKMAEADVAFGEAVAAANAAHAHAVAKLKADHAAAVEAILRGPAQSTEPAESAGPAPIASDPAPSPSKARKPRAPKSKAAADGDAAAVGE